MILTVRPAKADEALWLGSRLRPEDEREVEASTGRPAIEVVPLSFLASEECYTIRLTDSNGRPEPNPTVIFGVMEDQQVLGRGIVWLLSTTNIKYSPITILREAKYWLDHWNTKYPLGLHNFVDTRNDLHLRWLQLSGFTLGDTYQQRNGQTFQHALRQTKE